MNLNKLMVQACTAAILSGSAAGAMAFADDDARRAILDLRAQVAALEEQLKNAQISFATRLDNLQNQNRLLTGQVEELTNAIRQEKRSTRELYTSIDERLGKFEPREVEVNGEKVTDVSAAFPCTDFCGEGLVIKKGKKVFHKVIMDQ